MSLAKSIPEIERLSKELHSLIYEIDKKGKEAAELTPFDLTTFVLPKDPKYMAHQRFKSLREQLIKQKQQYQESTKMIPEIEDTLVPSRHHLTLLQMEENSLKPLEIKLNELELQEEIEKDIVEKYKNEKSFKRQLKMNSRLNKARELKELEEAEKQALNDLKEKKLKKKRAELMAMLRNEMHQVGFITCVKRTCN